jgi:pSer/pThr/pTyr-binding forkhead associated (FHA) protein
MKTNDIVLGDAAVSRRHCAIVNYSQDVWLYDLGSTVGTFVDGQRLTGRMFLQGVHEVMVGGVQIRVAAHRDLLI